MVDSRRSGLRHHGLAVIGDAQARRLDHRDVVGAVADRQRFLGDRPKRSRSSLSVSSLASRPRIGSATPAREAAAAIHEKRVGAVLVEADQVPIRPVNSVKPPDTRQV